MSWRPLTRLGRVLSAGEAQGPVGVEHQPVAAEEAELLVIEPSGTPNTGDGATAARRVVI